MKETETFDVSAQVKTLISDHVATVGNFPLERRGED